MFERFNYLGTNFFFLFKHSTANMTFFFFQMVAENGFYVM